MSNVDISRDGAVLTVTFDRPEKKNALTKAMYTAAEQALRGADADPGVRVVIITGAGDAFTSGNDIADFREGLPADPLANPVVRFLRALIELETPLIAAVNGTAVGVGVTLLLHCDLVYAAHDAKMVMPFSALGLCPEAGSSYLLPMMVGHRFAAELLMLGETFDGRRATALGIANDSLPADSVLPHAQARAQRLARLPAGAVRDARRLLKAPFRETLDEVFWRELEVFGGRLGGPENTEALDAFFDKRPPDFSKFE